MSCLRPIVLTGGIASGKSTFARCYAAAGGTVLEADDVVRALTQPGGALHEDFLNVARDAHCIHEGRVDRAQLRRRMFIDRNLRHRLEALIHPRVVAEMTRRIAQLSPPVLAVVPLFTEITPPPLEAARVVVIDCPHALQLARLATRDGYDETFANLVLSHQASRSRRLAIADDLLMGDLSLSEVEQAAIILLQRHRTLLGLT